MIVILPNSKTMVKAGVTCTSLLALFLFLSVQFCASNTTELNRRETFESDDRFVVVFDAGKISTDVHVFRFDENVNLLMINRGFEVYQKVRQPLTSYVKNPAGVASIMTTLLETVLDTVPADLQPETPVLFGAFDELFLLGEEKYEEILEVIRDVLSKSPLLCKPEWVSIIPAAKQGAYVWDTVNYLMGNLGSDYSKTVAVLTQESASAEIAYAISSKAAANAPSFPGGEQYISTHLIQSNRYYL